MVEHYSSRDFAPSKTQIMTSSCSFSISRSEFQHLRSIHHSLHIALNHVQRLKSGRNLSSSDELRALLLDQDKSHVDFDGRDVSFMTTEIVFNQDRQPYIVSIDAHSARHWDSIFELSRTDPASLTRSDLLIEAIRNHFRHEIIVMMRDSQDRERYPNLKKALTRQGVPVQYRSLREIDRETEHSWQCLFELPFMQVRKRLAGTLQSKASFLIQPLLHLSGQRILMLLSCEEFYDALQDSFLKQQVTSEELQLLYQSVPKTYPVGSLLIPSDAIVKLSAPLSSQRKINQYHAIPEIHLKRYARGMVAQELIHPLKVEIPKEHMKCPLRLILVSYRGEILTGMGIAGVPANGHPAREAMLDIMIR